MVRDGTSSRSGIMARSSLVGRRRGPPATTPPAATRRGFPGYLDDGLAGRGRRRHVAQVEAAPEGRQLLALEAAVDLQPADGVVEVWSRGEGLLHAGRAMHVAEPSLRDQDQTQPIEVTACEGQRERGRRAGGSRLLG